MEFGTDSHFLIGHAHVKSGTPCQDFALSGVFADGGVAFAIACDGCSTADRNEKGEFIPGIFSGMGSQTLGFATRKAIKELWQASPMVEGLAPQVAIQQRMLMNAACTTLGLTYRDMYTTCVYAILTPQGGFVHLQGDGVVAVRRLNGEVTLYRYDWQNNTPFYPAYASMDNCASFVGRHGGLDAKALQEEIWIKTPDGNLEQLGGENYSVYEGIRGVTIGLPDVDDIELVAVFTDGVTQVEGVDWKDAALALLNFKTTAGQFATRRMNRFVSDVQPNGRGLMDDGGYACILRVTEEE